MAYSGVYEISDVVNIGIDFVANIFGGLLGSAEDVGTQLGTALSLTVMIVVLGLLMMIVPKVIRGLMGWVKGIRA